MTMHRMFHAAIFAISVAAVHAALAAGADADKQTFYEMSADGTVQIAPDGHVSDYRLESNLQPAVADIVRRNVMGWQFEPIVINGKPVVAKTAMHLKLRAEPVAEKKDEFSLHVGSVYFGNPTRHGVIRPPHYPASAAGARLGALVLLSARLDEDGRVAEVYPYQTSLDAHVRNEKEAERWRGEFEKAALAAAKTWQYDLTEIVGGHKDGAYVSIPVQFHTSALSHSSERWRGYEAGPIHPAPWARAQEPTQMAQLQDGATSTSSRFHLKNDVIGKAL